MNRKFIEEPQTGEEKMENTLTRAIHAYEYDCICFPVNLNEINKNNIDNANKLLEAIRFYRGNIEEVYYNPSSSMKTKDLAKSFLNKLTKDEIALFKFLNEEKGELDRF